MKEILGVLKDAALKWSEDSCMQLGGALAYYTIFSFAPLLLIVIALASLIWGTAEARVHLLNQLQQFMDQTSIDFIRTMLDNVSRPGQGNTLATVFGLLALFFGATAVLAQLQASLNAIWNVQPDPKRGFLNLLKTRVLSFGLILLFGLLLLSSLVITSGLRMLEGVVTDVVPEVRDGMYLLNLLVSFGVVTLFFAMIYRILPDVEIAWRDVWVGAFITAVLFTLGNQLLGFYIGTSGIASAYGAAGSLVIMLVWIYYSSLIFFFGAEITQVYAARYGTRIRPSDHAVVVRRELGPVQQKVAEEGQMDLPKDGTASPNRSSSAGMYTSWKQLTPVVVAAFLVGRFLGRK